jgi:catechol 2,3-dioxygenase-like lactoylglutathione lyase family enzyme
MNEEIGAGVFRTGHVGLNVSDVGRSKKFYGDVFGFRPMGESEEAGRRYVFLGDSEKIVLTLWQQGVGCFDKGTPGLHHLSFEVGSIEEVREAETRLREMGVPLIYGGAVPHAEGMQSGGIFFEDPDGIRLEIFSPTGAAELHAPRQGAPSCGFF